jgi:hypothetical protein
MPDDVALGLVVHLTALWQGEHDRVEREIQELMQRPHVVTRDHYYVIQTRLQMSNEFLKDLTELRVLLEVAE